MFEEWIPTQSNKFRRNARRIKALDMRMRGYTFQAIADTLKISITTAWFLIHTKPTKEG